MMANIQLKSISTQRVPTVSEQVFNYLHERILTLELPPGTKMSEIEVSKQMDISRQPVREAFFRLSQLGFLLIRPQRATVVQTISETEVLQAMYIRAALEIEVVRNATELITADQLKTLSDLLDQQQQAISDADKILFHTLDDRFHKNICIAADAEFVWTLIKEKKGSYGQGPLPVLGVQHKNCTKGTQDNSGCYSIQKQRSCCGCGAKTLISNQN